MKTNFKKFMAMMLAVMMVFGAFSTLATASNTSAGTGVSADAECPGSADGKHHWMQYGSDEEAVVDRTCTTNGYTWVYCTGCNKKDIQDIVLAPGDHDFEVTERVEATCQKDGYILETCQNEWCKETRTTVLPKDEKAHNFEWHWDSEVKCGELGVKWLVCTNPQPRANPGLDGVTEDRICGYVASEAVYEVKPHNYVEYELLEEPTCYKYGTMLFKCTQDGCDSTIEVDIDYEDHKLVDHEGQAATCTEDGWKPYQTCSVEGCGYTTYEKIPATDHDYDAVVTAPTCDAQGYTTYTCKNDSTHTYVGDYVDALGHDMGDWYETTAPECEGEGAKRRDCKRGCGYFETDVVGATGHDYKGVVTAPTCTEKGYTTYTCANGCGSSYVGDYVDATGHDYKAVVTDPTHTDKGYTTYTCSCGDSYVDDYVDPVGHEWGEWVITKKGNCLIMHTWTRVCSCGAEETKQEGNGPHTMPADTAEIKYTISGTDNDAYDSLGQPINREDNTCSVTYNCVVCTEERTDVSEHRDLKHTITAYPSCTTKGCEADFCDICGYFKATFTDELVHKYEAKVTAPTCDDKGYTTYTCTQPDYNDIDPATGKWTGKLCGHTYTDNEVPALGHDYEAVVTAPDCVNDGYTTYTCKNDPQHTYVDDHVAALGHTEGTPVVENNVDPDCINAGGYDSVVYCSVDGCGVELSRTYVPVAALGHTEGAPVVENNVDPDCTTAGGYDSVVYCSVDGCGAEISRTYVPVAALGHTPRAAVEENRVSNTCITDGGYDMVVYCDVCGEEISRDHTVIPADPNAHPVDDPEWAYFVITKDPTCTEGGEATVYCDMCHAADKHKVSYDTDGIIDVLKQALAPTGHEDLDDCTITTVEPTCQADGYKSWVCDKCGEEIKREVITLADRGLSMDDPAAHTSLRYHDLALNTDGLLAKDFGGKGYARTPSCASNGILWYYCDACAAADPTYQGFTVTEEGSMMDCHDDLANLTLDRANSKAPTCTEDGVNAYFCKHPHYVVYWDTTLGAYVDDVRECPYTTTEVVPATGHDQYYVPLPIFKTPDVEGKEFKLPTCTEDGSWWKQCGKCGEWVDATDGTFQWNGIVDWKALGHDEVTVVTDPTCTDKGYTTHTCTRCDYNVVDTYVDANGHDMGDWYEVTPAECEVEGLKRRDCKNCNYYETDAIAATGHTEGDAATCDEAQICTVCKKELAPATGHDYEAVVTDPTCTEGGYTTYTCKNDPTHTYVGDRVAALDHDMGELYVVTPATCEVDGLKQSDCKRGCGHFVTEPIPATGHDYEAVVTDPTCTEGGYTTYTCKNDPTHTYVDDRVPALDHDYVLTDSKASTCKDKGYETYTCSRCGDSYTDELPLGAHVPCEFLMGHVCDDPEHTYAPTCTKPGAKYGRLCQVCGGCVNEPGVDHEPIPPLGGSCDFQADRFVVIADCVNYGFTYIICPKCGDGYGNEGIHGLITDYVPALGHDWIENVVKDATCTEDGYYYADCSRCDEIIKGETIPATGHKAPNHTDGVDANGDPIYCPEHVTCENGCGTVLFGHRDAEGNNLFDYVEEVIVEEVVVNGVSYCYKTHYTVEYCYECNYKHVDDDSIWLDQNVDHKMVIDEEQSYEATETTSGKIVWVCENGCGHSYEKALAPTHYGKVEFDNEIYGCDTNGDKNHDGMIVNGGYMALRINMTGCNVDVWGISFDLAFDNSKLVFDAELTAEANKGNGYINDFNAVGGTLRVMSTYEEGDGLQNNNFTGVDVEYLTLIFAVKSTAYSDKGSITADKFAFKTTEVINSAKVPATSTFNELGETVIYKAADLDASGTFGLGDANDLMTLIVDGGYDARADIDWNGDIDFNDFLAIKKILMNDGLIDGIYEDILDGYYKVA
ncbi:MAG: hypothetical protein E7661_06935 [Ruminococcaceae bacterium]|nr:hypothetical protein [Oscillospiraceae bacterium]